MNSKGKCGTVREGSVGSNPTVGFIPIPFSLFYSFILFILKKVINKKEKEVSVGKFSRLKDSGAGVTPGNLIPICLVFVSLSVVVWANALVNTTSLLFELKVLLGKVTAGAIGGGIFRPAKEGVWGTESKDVLQRRARAPQRGVEGPEIPSRPSGVSKIISVCGGLRGPLRGYRSVGARGARGAKEALKEALKEESRFFLRRAIQGEQCPKIIGYSLA